MSLIKVEKSLRCGHCPFLDCYERGTCYECKCFLDKTMKIEHFCDHGGHPLNCPLLDGRTVAVWAEKGMLKIVRDHEHKT
jgi:hypothetical protein